MTTRDFCYWLQGYFEIHGADCGVGMTGHQVDMIRRHLSLVCAHDIDQKAGGPGVQKELDDIHTPSTTAGFLTVGNVVVARC